MTGFVGDKLGEEDVGSSVTGSLLGELVGSEVTGDTEGPLLGLFEGDRLGLGVGCE